MRMLELRDNFSSYDAVYVALAQVLQASLLTADRPLRGAVTTYTNVTTAP